MGATNHTANYDLPQWIGTDKPTFLGDLNDAFLKIDTGMKTNQSEISGATSDAGNALAKATSAEQAVNTLTPLVNTASKNASQALTTANNAASTANTANTNANAAISKLNGFNWSASTALTKPVGTPWEGHTVNYCRNSGLYLLNLYGEIIGSFNNSDNMIANNSVLFTLPSSFPAPTQKRSIFGGILIYATINGVALMLPGILEVNTDRTCVGVCNVTQEKWNFCYIQVLVNTSSW